MESSSSNKNSDPVQLGFAETPRKGDFELKNFPSKIKKKKTSNPFLPLLFNTILEVLATTMRDRK